MVADAEGAPDYSRHALGGPHIADEVVRLRPLRHERGELRALLGGELGDATGWRMPMQYLHPACARPLQPGAHRRLARLQRLGNRLPAPARLMQLPGAQPPPLTHILTHRPLLPSGGASGLSHARPFHKSSQRSVDGLGARHVRLSAYWSEIE